MSATLPTDALVWEDTVRQLVEDLAELPTQWRDQPRDFVGPDATGEVLIVVTTERAVGVDERRLFFNAAAAQGEEYEPTQVGQRRLTLQVQVVSYDQSASTRARWFLERIRMRLRRPSSLEALRSISTALVTIGPTFVVPTVVDNRAISVATTNVELGRAVEERDEAFGYIETIEGTQTITADDGSAIATPVSIDLSDP